MQNAEFRVGLLRGDEPWAPELIWVVAGGLRVLARVRVEAARLPALGLTWMVSAGLSGADGVRCCALHTVLPGCATADRLPAGTITWTSPTGRTYTTHAGSRLLFPTLCLPTGELPAIPTAYRPPGDRDIMMPTRRRTRQQDRAHRINAERALNAAHIAERNQPPPF